MAGFTGSPGRGAAFDDGQFGAPSDIATSAGQDPGLTMNSLQFRAQVPDGYRPQSVLSQVRPSMNGMSAQDYARVMPGGYTLPTQNGQSQSSWETSNLLRMQGQDAI